MANIRRCKNCRGTGSVTVEIKPGKWVKKECIACDGTGKIVISTI